MSNLIIKGSEIANLTDARYFSAREVDWLGFSIDNNSENYLPANQIIAIREWVSGPRIIVELGSLSGTDIITQVIEILKPDAIQLGPFSSLDEIENQINIPLIKEFIPDSLEQLEDYFFEWREWEKSLTFFLLNLEKNAFSWQQIKNDEKSFSLLKQLCTEYDLMLSLDFNHDELSEILTILNPYGLSFNGGAEEKVGMKSFEALDDIFDKLEDIKSAF